MHLVFLVEESSMADTLDIFLPRFLPDTITFQTVPHEGKQDLEKSLPRKLRGWVTPGVFFIVMRDNDGADCIVVKDRLTRSCKDAGREDTLVRLVCQELEAWFLGDLEAVEKAFGKTGLREKYQSKKRFRDPDATISPSEELTKICGSSSKRSRAKLIAEHLSIQADVNKSYSFSVFLSGVQHLIK